MTAKFEVGKTYGGRMIGDAQAIVSITVASRTAKTITTTEGKRLGIAKAETGWNDAETVFPFGRYSKAPIIRADREIAPVEEVVAERRERFASGRSATLVTVEGDPVEAILTSNPEQEEPSPLSRHDFLRAFWSFINKAVELRVCDAIDVYALAATNGSDTATTVDEILQWAFSSRLGSRENQEKHATLAKLADQIGVERREAAGV